MNELRRLVDAGVAALRADRVDEALSRFAAARTRAPDDAELLSLHGLTLARLNRFDEAAPALLRAVEKEPGEMGFRLNLAEFYERTGQFAEAARELRIIVGAEPHFTPAWARLTAALTKAGQWRELVEAGEHWRRIAPRSEAALEAVARGKFELGDRAAAYEAYHLRRQLNPGSLDAQCDYALCCLAMGRFDDAAAALDVAESMDADCLDMLAGKARLLTYLGRFAEAERYCRRCIRLDPAHVQAYALLSQLTGGRLSAAETDSLARLADREDIAIDECIEAAFAMARAKDADDDIDGAFAAYTRANTLCLRRNAAEGLRYDAKASEARTQAIMAHSAAPSSPLGGGGAPTPIFIIGMPRSGTTLVESVLAEHPKVEGKGELSAMRHILQSSLETPRAEPAQMEAWARAYLEAAAPARDVALFTDKMPMNFEAVGLIAQLFPRSPIIDVRRDPLETGFSIFRQGMTKFMTFANCFEDIAHAYAQYARLMAHWRAEGVRIIALRYEEFVADFDRAAPALVGACDLAWDEACRNFQDAPRAIATFSTVQVRKPLSLGAGAVARFGRRLDPLRDAFKRERIDLDTGEWLGG